MLSLFLLLRLRFGELRPEHLLGFLLYALLPALLNGFKIYLISFFLSFSSIVLDFLNIDYAGDSLDICISLRRELLLLAALVASLLTSPV